jgi:hypothetical protein
VDAQTVEAVASVVVAATALGGVGFAISQLRESRRAEKRRSQPVVVLHEAGPRRLLEGGGTAWDVCLENHGAGTAFNVRFGVDLDGRRYPHKPRDSERAYRHIVNAGERLPAEGNTFELPASIAPFVLQRAGPGVDARRIFWARYENSFGEHWETRNPGDPTADWVVQALSAKQVKELEANEADARGHDEGVALSHLSRELRALEEANSTGDSGLANEDD